MLWTTRAGRKITTHSFIHNQVGNKLRAYARTHLRIHFTFLLIMCVSVCVRSRVGVIMKLVQSKLRRSEESEEKNVRSKQNKQT